MRQIIISSQGEDNTTYAGFGEKICYSSLAPYCGLNWLI